MNDVSKQVAQISWTVDRKGGAVRKTAEFTYIDTDAGRSRLAARLEKIADKGGYSIECRYEVAPEPRPTHQGLHAAIRVARNALADHETKEFADATEGTRGCRVGVAQEQAIKLRLRVEDALRLDTVAERFPVREETLDERIERQNAEELSR